MSGVRLRRLGAEMARLRQERNLTKDQVAAATGISVQSLWRLESAQSRVQKRTVVTLLTLYQAPEDVRAELLALHRTAKETGLLTSHARDMPGEYPAFIGFEAEAIQVLTFECQAVPGLLQTERYARAVIEATTPYLTEPAWQKRVDVRMHRQALLRRQPHPLRLWAIVDEAAVRRQTGGAEVMEDQIEQLIEASLLPNVTLQLLPFSHGAHAGIPGAFIILDFAEPDPSLVYLENQAGDIFLDSKEQVTQFKTTFDHLRASALDPVQSRKLLKTL